MTKRLMCLAALVMFILAVVSLDSFGAEKTVKKDDEKIAKKAAVKDMTKEELITHLKDAFQSDPDIIAVVTGLEARTDASGINYSYKGKKIEDLDKETLVTISKTVNTSLSLKNTQRIQRQLRNMEQVNNMNKMQNMLQQQRQIKTYTVPKTYTPPNTYTPPRTYAPPPQAPRK